MASISKVPPQREGELYHPRLQGEKSVEQAESLLAVDVERGGVEVHQFAVAVVRFVLGVTARHVGEGTPPLGDGDRGR